VYKLAITVILQTTELKCAPLPVLLLYVSLAFLTAAGPDTRRSTCGHVPTAFDARALCYEQLSAAAVEPSSLSVHQPPGLADLNQCDLNH